MDPLTALLLAVLMMLLNGGVLGLMHRDLPASLRPSATSWRIATLLQAGGCVLLAVQRQLPLALVLPLANGMLILGITGYWRALRQFYGYADSPWLLLPTLVGTLGIFWFAAVTPDLGARVIVASATWCVLLVGAALTLRQAGLGDQAMSRRVLAWIFGVVALFMVVRILQTALSDQQSQHLLDNRNWMNVATPIVAAIMPVIGTTAFLLMCSQRITRQWEIAASTDYLTGLANRRTLTTAGEIRLEAVRTTSARLAVAVIDIDHFKAINDRHGHDIGDEALKHVAALIDRACRDRGQCGRQGGEEFVALLDNVDAAAASATAEQLRASVQTAPFQFVGGELPITISIGVALAHSGDRRLDDLLRRADQALYRAKAGGRNRVELAA